MNDASNTDQTDENVFTLEVSDEALEAAAGGGRVTTYYCESIQGTHCNCGG